MKGLKWVVVSGVFVASGLLLANCSPSPRMPLKTAPISTVGAKQITVPNLTELTIAQAKLTLSAKGLILGTIDLGDSLLPKGEIFEQTPAMGTSVTAGTKVNVVQSAGIGLTGPQNRPVKTVDLPKDLLKMPAIPPGRLIKDYKATPITKSKWCMPHLVVAKTKTFLAATDGARVELIAEGLHHPRNLAEAPNGDIFVVESRIEVGQAIQPNRVVVVRPGLKHPVVSIWADKLNLPFGIAFYKGYVYVANTGTVIRWKYNSGQTIARKTLEMVFSKIPERGMRQHWTRNILFDPARSQFFVTIGSKANVDLEETERATIGVLKLTNDGHLVGPLKTYAGGMRNPVGLGLNPINGDLLTCVNERDYLGDELVPDYVTSVHPGQFFGWPYFWIGNNRELRVPPPPKPLHVDKPDAVFAAHSAPLGLVAKGNYVYVALHGSQNRALPVGYSIVRIPLNPKTGAFAGPPITYVKGWFIGYQGRKGYVYGRPAGLALDHNGNLLIADDWGGRLWRVHLK